MNNQWFAKVAVWMVVAMVLFTVFNQFQGAPTAGATALAYSDFLDKVRTSRIQSATIQEGPNGTEITAVTTDGQR
ncbi:MAG: ATP-dependent metallopeptidase FtsH/Yme1/Tma family protein, partial [Serpentinimonas sp.]|nr:ATP-dependent metallopeptidase FtsH/Yme1/Tma family protein [Serpentinimonas sp.]